LIESKEFLAAFRGVKMVAFCKRQPPCCLSDILPPKGAGSALNVTGGKGLRVRGPI